MRNLKAGQRRMRVTWFLPGDCCQHAGKGADGGERLHGYSNDATLPPREGNSSQIPTLAPDTGKLGNL